MRGPDHTRPLAGVRVLLAESGARALAGVAESLTGDGADVTHLQRGQAVLAALAQGRVDVLILGHALEDMTPADLLAALSPPAAAEDAPEAAEDAPEASASAAVDDAAAAADDVVAAAAGGASDSALPGDAGDSPLTRVPVLVLGPAPADHERVFYVIDRDLAPEHLRALVRSAHARALQTPQADKLASSAEPARLQRVLEVSRQLAAQRELDGAADVCVRALITLLEADRACCLFHDHESGALWAEGGEQSFDGSAAQGLAGFAARTGTAVHVARAGDDPRYSPSMDDPAGDGSEHLVLQPVLGSDGHVHAVLVAVRAGDAADFGPAQRAELALLAEQAAPLFDLLSRHIESTAALEAARSSVFRREAFDAYVSWQEHGDVLRVSPRWLGWTFWLLVAVFAAAAVYMVVGTVNEYSTGLAIVRMNGRTEIAATVTGTISEILVVPGQRVRKDQVLVRLHDTDAVAEYRRIEEEFEAQLRNLLRAPGDAGLRQTVASLRAQKDRAASQIEERLIRAAHGGTVSDVRIRQGQALSPGGVLLSLIDDESDLGVIALMPGGDRPLIAPGMLMRLELSGYQYAYQNLTVDSVADEVIGPAEVNRYLGPTIGDSIELTGPVVLVRAHLPTTEFVVDDEEYRYHDGMQGIAEVRVRSRTILQHLFPELRRL
jgi:multidrug efflux pump subunit AcrA (membrane-fusion protein)